MELSTYLSILRRRKWIVILSVLLGTAIAVAMTYLSTPQYVASTTVRVATVGGGSVTNARPDITYTERLINTYSRIITSNSVRQELKEELGLTTTPNISVQAIPGTELIRLIAEAPDPDDARDIANGAANILIEQNRAFYSGGAGQTLQEILAQQLEQAQEEERHQQCQDDNDDRPPAAGGQAVERVPRPRRQQAATTNPPGLRIAFRDVRTHETDFQRPGPKNKAAAPQGTQPPNHLNAAGPHYSTNE